MEPSRPSAPSQPLRSFRRPPVVVAGAVAALGLGVLALVSAFLGLAPGARAPDSAAALPNLLTGLASVAGGLGYWGRRRWAVPVYGLSVLGHLAVHGAFLVSAFSQARVSLIGTAVLAAVPILALLVLAGMELQRRKGALS